MNFRIVGAILMKDVRSLYPLLLLAALLFGADVFIERLELMPTAWAMFRWPVLLLAGTVMIFAIFQADPVVSMVDDWLCRPVPRAELLTAKLALALGVLYFSRFIAALALGPFLGASLAESLQMALLLEDVVYLLVLAIVLFTALVTRTIVQGIGVLIAIFTLAFVVPTPIVSAPGPLEPAIGEALLFGGLGWLAYIPATMISLGLFVLACWLVYWRRKVTAARIVLGGTALLALLLVLLPMWLVPWRPVFKAHTTLAPAGTAARTERTRPIYLHDPSACFPATRLRNIGQDPAFTAARQAVGVPNWSFEDQRESGPDSVVFLSSIAPRRVPPDWRVKLAYVEAEYHSAPGTPPLYELRPTTYNVDHDGVDFSHAWVLPEAAVRRLGAEPDVQLELRYYFTLLEPHSFRMPADGRRHSVPKVGYCAAKLDATGSHVEVDCFTGFEEPAQISAELEEIPSSRVHAPADYSPRWTRWPFGSRHKLSIQSPRLAKSDHVVVTAWIAAGHREESLVLPGILGGDADTCPLPTAGNRQFQQAMWRDTAPHEAISITVDEGVQLEVLDFGGRGSPILLLPGLGATAHSYDELAPRLAEKHRVFAITRRGTGFSSKPDFGFDTPRLAQDVLRVMDALDLKQALLVGHSIAGDELTWLGGHHAERFSGLVYLDAAYDRSEGVDLRVRELNGILPPEPPIPPSALRDYAAMSKLIAERGHVRLTEGELIAALNIDKPFLAGTPTIDNRTRQAIMAAIEPPDYGAVKIPALAVYAFEDPAWPLPPWYDANDAELKAALEELGRNRDEKRRKDIESFRRGVEKGQILELQKASHYLIQSNQQQVLEAIEEFSRRALVPASDRR